MGRPAGLTIPGLPPLRLSYCTGRHHTTRPTKIDGDHTQASFGCCMPAAQDKATKTDDKSKWPRLVGVIEAGVIIRHSIATRWYAIEEHLRTKQKTLLHINQNPRISEINTKRFPNGIPSQIKWMAWRVT